MGICQRLIPMATSGDGNCLLHAASLGKNIETYHDIMKTDLFSNLYTDLFKLYKLIIKLKSYF